MERLQEQVTLYRERDHERRIDIETRKSEIREAIAMQYGPWQAGFITESHGIQESASGVSVVVKERLAELELAIEDRGWQRELAQSTFEFSRWGIRLIILMCRLYRIKNTLIQRGILVSCFYVFGRFDPGTAITSDDETAAEVLKAFFTDPRNTPHIGHSALVKKEAALYTDGNIFWTFFTDVSDGQTLIRTIDALEIEEIVCDPDDSSVPWYYRRRWVQMNFDEATGIRDPKPMEAWYVALGFTPPAGVRAINGIAIMTDKAGQMIPVLHQKDGELEKWHFGCPRAYAAVDWAAGCRDFLTNFASVIKAAARLTQDVETKGGPAAIANIKQAFATTLGNNGTMLESNPPPETASAFVHGPGTKYGPIKTAGLTTGPEEGRRLFHQVYMVFGLPETFFSDASVGSLATAQSLDRPTELKFDNDQEAWRETFKRIGGYVLERSATAPKGKLREARRGFSSVTSAATINVNFPPIVEGDIPTLMNATVQALTLGGYPAIGIDEKTGVKAMLSMLSAYANIEIDVEEVVEAMYPEKGYQEDRNEVLAAKKDQTINPPPPPTPGAPVNGKPKPSVKEAAALIELRRAMTVFKANGADDSKKKTVLH